MMEGGSSAAHPSPISAMWNCGVKSAARPAFKGKHGDSTRAACGWTAAAGLNSAFTGRVTVSTGRIATIGIAIVIEVTGMTMWVELTETAGMTGAAAPRGEAGSRW